MPVPSSITSLSQTAGSNSPAGSESPALIDDYLRALSAFIAFLRDDKVSTSSSYSNPAWIASLSGAKLTAASVAASALASGAAASNIGPGGISPSLLSTGAPAWDTSGNLGVGTASPGGKVEIANNGLFALRLNNTSGSAWQSEISWCGAGAQKWAAGCDFGNSGNNNFYLYDSVANTKRLGIDTSGNLQFNSGYGYAATAYGCRAWVNFNGTGSIGANQFVRGAGNVSSVYKNGTGDYTINFVTAMPDANYCVQVSSESNSSWPSEIRDSSVYYGSVAAGSVRVKTGKTPTGYEDENSVFVAIFR